jgi:membrane dipeptidase
VREAALSAATWVITTNPLRDAGDRFHALLQNLTRLNTLVREQPEDLLFCRTLTDYRAARQSGRHAVFVGIQGGNALDGPADAVERLPWLDILRVTLVHLSSSSIGTTSSPLRLGPDRGLSAFGQELVQRLNAARILVDLAHISAGGFWAALDAHDRYVPVVVTHTGVSGVHRHWRNLDDSQLRAIADSGGFVGIMFHSSFLGDKPWSGRAARVVDHLAHVVRVAGEDCPALGSDFDGAIVPPRDLQSVLELPRLVELMLQRGLRPALIKKILGQNFLRVLGQVRP